MIRTKEAQLINPQLGESDVVYFKTLVGISDHVNDLERFNIGVFVKKMIENVEYFVPAYANNESMGTFQKSTFLSIFGAMTLNDFHANLDFSLMQQIEYINNFNWSGVPTEQIIRFWDLSASDMEIVPANEMCEIRF